MAIQNVAVSNPGLLPATAKGLGAKGKTARACHCEERSDVAIQNFAVSNHGLLPATAKGLAAKGKTARNDRECNRLVSPRLCG